MCSPHPCLTLRACPLTAGALATYGSFRVPGTAASLVPWGLGAGASPGTAPDLAHTLDPHGSSGPQASAKRWLLAGALEDVTGYALLFTVQSVTNTHR